MIGELAYFVVAQDGSVEAYNLKPLEKFSLELLQMADPEVLSLQDGMIRLNCDNGSWVWRVTDVDEAAGVVTGQWPD